MTDTQDTARKASWSGRALVGAAALIFLAAIVVVTGVRSIENTQSITKIERVLACENPKKADSQCVAQARRMIRACVLDPNCRKLFRGLTAKERRALVERVAEQVTLSPEGGDATSKPSQSKGGRHTGPPPGGSRSNSFGSRPPGQVKPPGQPACPPKSNAPHC